MLRKCYDKNKKVLQTTTNYSNPLQWRFKDFMKKNKNCEKVVKFPRKQDDISNKFTRLSDKIVIITKYSFASGRELERK